MTIILPNKNQLTLRQKKSQSPKMAKPVQQQGVALLTILLLVVAITVVAGAMVATQRLSIRQYELLLTQDQIAQDIKTGEQMAAALIKADAKLNDTDSVLDAWAQPLAPVDYGNHSIKLDIQDASARFNLNNLYHDGKADEQAVESFKRLLSAVGLEPSLAYAVLDWQDADNETSPDGGAEADAYQARLSMQDGKAGMIASIANQPFVSVDELASVKGFTPDKMRALKPYVTAVPYYLPINLNTADAVVLSTLVEGSTSDQFDDFAEQVKNNPVTSVDEVVKQPPWSTLDEDGINAIKPMMAVSSQAFAVLIDVAIEDKHRYATTIISKTQDSKLNDTNANGNQGGSQNDSQNASQPSSTQVSDGELKIQAFATRLWTYRPDF